MKGYESKRPFKGKSIDHYIEDYCLLDLETTDVFIPLVKIIEISVIKVRKNLIVDEYSTLINPECHIPEEATAVNHITDEMVKKAPILDCVIEDVLSFIGNDVIVGYNNASFDMNVLYDEILNLTGQYFQNNYIDLLWAARRSLKDVENYKLETICKYYGFDTEGEHRATKDCYLTKLCYERLFEEYGDSAFKSKKNSSIHRKNTTFSQETVALRNLQNDLKVIIAADTISEVETIGLQNTMDKYEQFISVYPFNKIFQVLNDVLEDGIVTRDESDKLKEIFTEVVDPMSLRDVFFRIKSLNGRHICLTGKFEYGDKKDVIALFESIGGVHDSSVKKSTDFVVVGSLGSENWKTHNYGGKIQQAIKFNEKGANIKIVYETEFIEAVKHLLIYLDA